VAIIDDPYDILEVARGASLTEIKKKYRSLVRALHPDKQIAAGVPPEMVKLANERLARINAAYNLLTKEAL
jgi:DnaJ like chaperone protein